MDTNTLLVVVIGLFALVAVAVVIVFRRRSRIKVKGPLDTELDVNASNDPPAPTPALTITPGERLKGMVHAEGKTAEGSLVLLFLASEPGKGLPPGSGELFRVWNARVQAALPVPELTVKRVDFGEAETIIDESGRRAGASLPEALALEQNIPNPFNPSTTISFAIPPDELEAGLLRVKLEIFNLRGALIRSLMDDYLPAGYHRVNWNGKDNSGRPLSSGVYFYRLCAGSRVLTRKMILLK